MRPFKTLRHLLICFRLSLFGPNQKKNADTRSIEWNYGTIKTYTFMIFEYTFIYTVFLQNHYKNTKMEKNTPENPQSIAEWIFWITHLHIV